ncbi:unnamed protein product [Spodoptera littoralis]|uniref:MOSC domain-containing protein n=1 Tax=Spodoptera littoralis TaxID=7109 RepID=A0A9P0HZZ9_SPOLI|nr:unnamed protein product [Spodoptera littoralis]CAH1637658.1 unnamed protein product [Spodoptera littoralis]
MSSNVPYYVTATVTAAGVLGSAYCAYRLFQDKPVKLPEKWEQVGVLKEINVYPIKSCGRVTLETVECTNMGLRDGWLRDRVLMVVDDKDNFITARGFPELLAVQPTIRNSVLTLEHPNMEKLHVNLAEIVALQKPKTAVVWGDPVPVYDCGWEVSEWFSRLIDRSPLNFRLVYYASENCRKLRGNTNKVYKFRKEDTGALPDETSFNLVNEASVDDLNTRLSDCKVSTKNFRPNFVLKGAKPYDEDNWKFVKIGENVFEIIKPCLRCVLTTIDPETGIRNANTEPLQELKKYRQLTNPEERKSGGSSPKMGLQMALRSGPGGKISLNDPIYVA